MTAANNLDPAATEHVERLRAAFTAAGQPHVFRFLHLLDAQGRENLFDQLEEVDLGLLDRLRRELAEDEPIAALDLERIAPADCLPLAATPGERRRDTRAARVGEDLLRAGKVAAFVVAGGQGSRLGFEGPKGCFPIGPVSDCSLFEWHCSKVLAARRRTGASLPLLVMTSATNHEATVDFLTAHRYFGLPQDDVWLFQQGMLPAVDRSGRLVLESPGSLFWSPDGHGGSLTAMKRHGVLERLEQRGVEHVFYFQVDNPLVKVLDPVFLGHHALARSEMSSKVVKKRDASEPVGVFARDGKKVGIVEYSDLPRALAEATDAKGELCYRAGSIAIHAIAVPFIRRLTERGLKLPYHRALKSVAAVDESGQVVRSSEKNAVKFESFIFDALPLAKRSLVVETARSEEFSPVKNRSGVDSADTARRDLCLLFRSWIEAAGLAVEEGDDARLEISPLFALDRAEFLARLKSERILCRERLLLR